MDLLSQIHKELNNHIELAYKKGATNFFKEKINPLGVRTPIVRKIAMKYFPKDKTKQEIFKICEQLLEKRTFEETTIAFAWARKMRKQFEKKDFARFEKWLKTYVDNWAFCDDFCTHIINEMITRFPELIPKAKAWHKSKNRWFRRASAVSFITTDRSFYVVKHNIKDIFDVADRLLRDEDDLVQKGYGWMLKAASVYKPAEVFRFVMKRKDKMPRTALRYAIEKYPKEMRVEAMKK